MTKDFEVINLRFWAKNARFTDYESVNFNEIGIEDIKENNDIYQKNIQDIVKKLLPNDKKIDKFYDLFESISISGFEPNIDEILVTRSTFLKEKETYIDKKIYYVLEGNRRLLCLYLLNNFYGIRNFFKELVGKNKFEKFEKLFDSKKNFSIIECKIFDVTYKNPDDIWKLLNSRHFGDRKGKLNWPRGLVLHSIYKKVINFRNKINKEKLDSIELELLKKDLESFTGKKISDMDLKAALWVTTVSNIYNNEFGVFDKINNWDTDDGMDPDNQSDSFSISSLEISYNTIKLKNENGFEETLRKIIDLDIDVSSWTITYDENKISKSLFEKLCIYIVKLIKNRDLTTRGYSINLILEIQNFINNNNLVTANEIIEAKAENKIYFENLSIYGMNKISEEKVIFKNSYEREIYKQMKDVIDPQISQIYRVCNELEKKLESDLIKNNKVLWTFLYIWVKEFKLYMSNKENLSSKYFPYLIVSSLIRSTTELIWNIITIYNPQLLTEFTTNFENYASKYIKNRYGEHIKQSIHDNTWTNHLLEDYCSEGCEGKKLVKIMNGINKKDILKNISLLIKEIEKTHDITLFQTDESKKIPNDIVDLLMWEENTNEVNQIIHKSHYIYDVFNETKITSITDNLKTKLKIIEILLIKSNDVLNRII